MAPPPAPSPPPILSHLSDRRIIPDPQDYYGRRADTDPGGLQWLEAGEFTTPPPATWHRYQQNMHRLYYYRRICGEVVKTISGGDDLYGGVQRTPINAPVQTEPGAEDNSTETQPPEPAEPGSSSRYRPEMAADPAHRG